MVDTKHYEIEDADRMGKILNEIYEEIWRATDIYNPMTTYHDGYAVIKEELDELWDEIKKTRYNRIDGNDDVNNNIRKEAIQVGAMVTRFILDLCDKE